MEPFRVHILGCGSALPTLKHFPSAQVVEVRGKLFLVDCGEGTQIQLRRSRLRFTKISAVFITHLHGDHCFGLIGMLSTFGLLGRTAKLTVYAPAELADILQRQIDFFCRDLDYEVEFVAVDTTQQQVIYDDRSLTVETLPLEHRVHCCGYLFREKPFPMSVWWRLPTLCVAMPTSAILAIYRHWALYCKASARSITRVPMARIICRWLRSITILPPVRLLW